MTIDECRDQVARLHGWSLPGDKGLLLDGTSVTSTAYHRKVFIEVLHTYRHDKQNEHPIPATTDAALEIIEKAGYRFLECSTRGGITVQAREWNRMTNFSPVEVTIPTMPWSNPHDTFKQALWNLAAAVTRQEGKQ
jgi:hypothetical protein